jgi:hypothetical protein
MKTHVGKPFDFERVQADSARDGHVSLTNLEHSRQVDFEPFDGLALGLPARLRLWP